VIPVSGSKLFFNEARVDRVISPVEVSQKNWNPPWSKIINSHSFIRLIKCTTLHKSIIISLHPCPYLMSHIIISLSRHLGLSRYIVMAPWRLCSNPDCKNVIVQGGLWVTHGAKRPKCKTPGCEKSVRWSDMCSAHG
jgi:hypothetical protein